MGEESDGDANLLEDESDPRPDPSGEADDPSDETDPGADASDSDAPDANAPDDDAPDADESETVTEPSDSPPEATAEDGGTPPADAPAVESEADAGEESEADAGEESDEDAGEEPDEDGNDQSGNLQPAERREVSLDPDQLDPDQRPAPRDPEEATAATAEPGELKPPDVHRPPEDMESEGESAPLAEDVARSDSLEEAAQRTEPLEDEEMPLADHIEEMLKRLAVVIVIAGVVSLAVLPFSEQAINFLWNSVLPAGESTRPRLYAPLALVLTKLKVASLAGIVIALPVFVYETYLFMRPGLYPHERRYYLAAIPTSLVLAFIGISFAYFLILPVIFEYFLYYSEDVTTIAFALTKTFDLILLLMGYLAIVFQIPLFIMLAIMMGLTTRRWLVERRLYFWGAFLGIAFLFSPDPTGMAPIMVATTMVALFEGTLFLLKWTGR